MNTTHYIFPLVLLIAGCAPADIRPDGFKRDGITPASVRKGRQILKAAADTHGLETWDGLISSEILLRDHWQGLMGKLFLPWPENNQLIRLHFLNNTYYGRAEFMEGKNQGEIWGVQAWQTYHRKPGQEVVFEEHGDTRFYLPTYQYFFEFPFQIRQAPIVAYIADQKDRGETYHLVFATWETPEPHPEYDQYIVWVNANNKRIERTYYTVRDIMRSASGSMFFSDFRTVGGILIPFTLTAGSDPTDYLHRLQIESVSLDAVPKDIFFPDPSKPFTADGKPE